VGSEREMACAAIAVCFGRGTEKRKTIDLLCSSDNGEISERKEM
jgi:hypothetical protein